MITNTVHFISMRTKTARGTHYHFTEEDREPSARLFTPPPPLPLGHFPPSPSHEGAVLLLLFGFFFFPFHSFSFFFFPSPGKQKQQSWERSRQARRQEGGEKQKKHRLINK